MILIMKTANLEIDFSATSVTPYLSSPTLELSSGAAFRAACLSE